MDKSGLKLNFLWSNGTGHRRGSPGNDGSLRERIKLPFLEGSSDVFQSRFFTLLLATLVTIVTLNLFLSFWLIQSLRIGNGGLGDGNLIATRKRMTVKGKATFNGWLSAEEINPIHRDQWMSIIGATDQLIMGDVDPISEDNQYGPTILSLSKSGLSYQGPKLTVKKLKNGYQQTQFSIDSDQLTTDSLRQLKKTDQGIVIGEMLGTPSIRGDPFHDLRLESRLKGLEVDSSMGDLDLRSRGGEINFNSYQDITLSSRQTKFDSSNLYLVSLPRAKPHRHHHTNDQTLGRKETISYQVCLCENGRLFLTHGDKACYLSTDICSQVITTAEGAK